MWILSLVFSWAFAQQSAKVELPFCEPAVFKKLQEAQSLGQWQVIPPAHPEHKVFRSPTKKLSQWVEIKLETQKVSVVSFTEELAQTWSFQKKNCKEEFSQKAMSVDFAKEGFQDSELPPLMSASKDTLIYIWNPAAGLSVSQARVYFDEAKKRGISVVSLLSPEADPVWAQKEIKKWGLPLSLRRLSSFELIMRGGNLHYPSVFFVGRGRISQRLMGGLEKQNVARFFDHFQEIK